MTVNEFVFSVSVRSATDGLRVTLWNEEPREEMISNIFLGSYGYANMEDAITAWVTDQAGDAMSEWFASQQREAWQ